jgi:hypothetical protein
MNEREGTELLHRIFAARGLEMELDTPFDELGVPLRLDGFDPERRIGFELITTEAGDRESFTPEVVERLEQALARGELYLLLVDEEQSEEELTGAAEGFLAELARLGRLP